MEINRRHLLRQGGAALAAGFTSTVPSGAASAAPGREASGANAASKPSIALFAAARRNADGTFAAAVFDANGRDINRVQLAGRGHDIAVSPDTQTCVAFARRPQNFAVAFSPDRRFEPIAFATPATRHFYGHGVFSSDGRLLYTTENDFDAGVGSIGIYDATARFKRIGSFQTHGIGPHDIAFDPDRGALVIANGGIETHPDFGAGRLPLNLATMAPSITIVATKDGRLLDRVTLPNQLHTLSLRHMGLTTNTLVVGAQDFGDRVARHPLIYVRHGDRDLKAVHLPANGDMTLNGYVSSIAISDDGQTAAVTSSRGNCIVFVDLATLKVTGHTRLQDVSGIAPASGSAFVTTSGAEQIARVDEDRTATRQPTDGLAWDNHAVRVRAA